MTAMTLNADRVRKLAETSEIPPISQSQADTVALILGDAFVAEDDLAWDRAWGIAQGLLAELRPDLAGDIMEIGFVAERVYPLVELGAGQTAAMLSTPCMVRSGEGVS